MKQIKLAEAEGLANSFLIFDLGTLAKPEEYELTGLRQTLVEKLAGSTKDTALVLFDLMSGSREKISQMRILERDGSESMMCGNGLRAVGKYFLELLDRPVSGVLTPAGIRQVRAVNEKTFEADLGNFNYEGRVVLYDEEEDTNNFVHLANVGEPHAIIFCAQQSVEKLMAKYGLSLAKYGLLDGQQIGTRNLNVVGIPDDFSPRKVEREKKISLNNRTFERGVNAETMACGTGSACVAGVINHLRKLTGSFIDNDLEVDITTKAGKLVVNLERGNASITGPANLISVQSIQL